MIIGDILKLSTRMFKTNPARTWLTILGMGVGTGAVVILVGLGFGLQKIMLEQIVFGETLLSLNVSNPFGRSVLLDKSALDEFMKIENVLDVSPMTSLPALMTFERFTGNVFLQGVKPSYFRYTGITASEGSLFAEESAVADRDNVVLSQGALKLFAIKDQTQALGKKVRFRVFAPKTDDSATEEIAIEKEYTVKGITKDSSAIVAMMTLDEFTSYFQVPYYERAQVRVSRSQYLDDVREKIIERGFIVTALSKTVEQANKIFSGLQAVLASFGSIALIVSAIGMFNTMTVTLLERINEIGIMRTIGASPRDIKTLFLAESVIVGLLGGIVGIILGIIVGSTLNFMVKTAAGYFGGKAMALFVFPFWFLLFIVVFSAVVGFLTGIFPARRAGSLNPLEAIRYK